MQKVRHLKSSSFLTVIFIVVFLFAGSVFWYDYAIDKIVENKEKTINSFKEEQFNAIWAYLENLQLQADKEITEISKSIEDDILSLSHEELEQLQSDLNNDTFNHNLHKIFTEHIEGVSFNGINNHMNGVVIMNNDGYLEDFNYHRATASNGSNIREWKIDLEKSYNKDLEHDAINKILNRNSGIIALESYNLLKDKDNDHILIEEMTYESLLNVYLNEGLNGLRNYQIFVPYYITDFGDIFGQPDILHGSKVDNNKLIIIQEFNLYDQITNTHKNLFNNDLVNSINNRYNDVLRILYIFGISLIASVLCLIFYLCNIYNKLVYHEEECETIINECKESLLDNEMQDIE